MPEARPVRAIAGMRANDPHGKQKQSPCTLDGHVFDWNQMSGDLFQVHCSLLCPTDAAVKVKYKGYWFYVCECDLDSKSTFNLLLELFNLEIRAGGGAQIPLLTI